MLNFVLMNGFASYFIVLTFVSLLSILWYFWFFYRPYSEFPACRLEHRILYWILKRVPLNYAVLQTFIKQARRYESEGVIAVWFGVPALLVYGEDIVKKIITDPAAVDKPKSYELLEYAIGKVLFTSNGETWKKQWKMAAPAFHLTALKSYTAIMNKNSKELIERLNGLKGQPTEDIINIVSLCAIGIILESNLGEKEKNLEEYWHVMNVLNKYTDFLMKRQWSPWLYFDFALKLFPSAREAHKLVTNLLEENVKPRLENIKESLISRQTSPHAAVSDLELRGRRLKSIGESYVEQHLLDPTITMDEVICQTSALVAAAFDTVVHSMKFALFLLGTHKDVQERSFEEVMTETEGHVTYDDLQRLTYLECVIKETLRLYPVPLFGRYLRKNLHCGKYKIPQNTTVAVFPYMLHRNPEIYPDPELFNPERFMDKNSKIKSWNYIPFSGGIRSCIGKNYALIEMKIILAHILRNFEIVSLNRIEEKDFSWALVMPCTKNLRMQFLPRNKEYHRTTIS